MSDMTIDPDGLSKALGRQLDVYNEELVAQLNDDIKEAGNVAKHAVTKAPAGAGRYRDWDDYSKGWKADVSEGKYAGETVDTVTVHNSKKPHLTHLLERGHEVIVNGRPVGRAKAFPHIAPAYDKAREWLEARLRAQ